MGTGAVVLIVGGIAIATWAVACVIWAAEFCVRSVLGGDTEYWSWREQPWGWRLLASAGIVAGCVAWMCSRGGPGPQSFIDYASVFLAFGAGVCGLVSVVVWVAFVPVRVADAAAAAGRRAAEWHEQREQARRAREAEAAREQERRRREEEDRREHERRMAEAPVLAAAAAERAARAEAERQRQERLRVEAENAARASVEAAEQRRRTEAAARAADARERKRAWDAAPKDRRCTHCGLRYPHDVEPVCVRCVRADGQEEVLAGG